MSIEPFIEASGAVFGYRGLPVVRLDRLELSRGHCLGVFGPNGVGKTTLLRGLTGQIPAMSGQVRIAPEARLAYVPQHRSMEPHWPMTAFDAASLAVSANRRWGWLGRAGAARVQASMRELNVERLSRSAFFSLSGGQQQRVMLAGALATDPAVVVLDEPTEGLDLQSRRQLLELLAKRKQAGLGILLVSHELEDLMELSDAVAWLHAGQNEGAASTVETTTAREVSSRLTATPRGGSAVGRA